MRAQPFSSDSGHWPLLHPWRRPTWHPSPGDRAAGQKPAARDERDHGRRRQDDADRGCPPSPGPTRPQSASAIPRRHGSCGSQMVRFLFNAWFRPFLEDNRKEKVAACLGSVRVVVFLSAGGRQERRRDQVVCVAPPLRFRFFRSPRTGHGVARTAPAR